MEKDNIKRYDFSIKPKNPSKLYMRIIKLFGLMPIKGLGFTCKKINMEGIKPPYFLLCNHASEMDFRILYKSIYPDNMNYVVAIDAMHDNTITLMRMAGGIAKRKFIQDMHLIRNLKYCAENYKNAVCVYPEARYTFDGTTSYLPPALGKMAKLLKLPVVVLISYGNFICCPQWNKGKFKLRPAHVESKLVCVATAEEVNALSYEELNKRIAENFVYDDLQYQYDKKISLTYPQRAKGLHHILYQCCECGTEFEMYSEGSTLECRHCGKKWEMTEYGKLEAHDGNTRFTHIPDWFRWERENVKREVEQGTYCIEDEIEIHTLPKNKYYSQGKGTFRQDMTGTHFCCNYYGKPFELHLTPNELESVHIEFDYRDRKKKEFFGDCIDISTQEDSFWIHPATKRDVIMKVSFATEELYQLAHRKLREKN
ncbi:MAG: hypothetical protein LUF82_00610 [Clostridia bacterium]|nr:hypothetical protein [Clostridia bacterium]